MACYSPNTAKYTTQRGETICDLLKKIDKVQKDAVLSEIQGRCDNCALPLMFNTKPIAIWTECGRFEAIVRLFPEETTTGLFRVEEVRDCETVVLRLLEVCNGKIKCTDETVTLRIACICAVQCFDPIHCQHVCFKVTL